MLGFAISIWISQILDETSLSIVTMGSYGILSASRLYRSGNVVLNIGSCFFVSFSPAIYSDFGSYFPFSVKKMVIR